MMRAPALLMASAVLSACAAVGPDYRPPTAAELPVPTDYYGAPQSPSPAELARWWQRLDDPMLDAIVARVASGNLDLAVATARLRQAREALVQARAGRLPTLSASAGVRESADGDGIGDPLLSVDADASWEADLFGGISRSIEAARADAEATGYDLGAVRVAVVAETVTNYVEARLAQQRLALARDTLAIADENLQIARWRVEAGLVSSLDVEQARGARAQTAAIVPSLESSFSSAVFRLSVLTGQPPAALIDEMEQAEPIPAAPVAIAAGIPADTLRQRPDVRAAERTLAAQTARIGVAEAQLYPALRLAWNGGSAALGIGGLIDQISGSLFAGLTQLVFDGGRARSQVRAQQAAAEAALAGYRGSVLGALEDVENALAALKAAERRRAEFAVALDAATNQAVLARSAYRAGLTDFQTLLEAERSLISARDGVLTSEADRTLAFVRLSQALGGGWTPLSQDMQS